MSARTQRRARAWVPALLLTLLASSGVASGEGLELARDVVVKFDVDGELVVRDGIVVEDEVVFTSLNDDSHAGQTGVAPSSPAAGDWRGVWLERSSSAQLDGLTVLFGGGGGVDAFTLRGTSVTIDGLTVRHSANAGIGATTGSTSTLVRLIVSDNDVGVRWAPGATASVSLSLIERNASWGGLSEDPSQTALASGVWWGHPSGPLDDSDDTASGGLFNPGGQGNSVSDGVDYTPFSDVIPLFGMSFEPIGGSLALQRQVEFALSARTATSVRLSESIAFPGVPFDPVTNRLSFTLSEGDGPKTVYAQVQAATGNTAVLNALMSLDVSAPTLEVLEPAGGAVLSRPLVVSATATDASGIDRVEFLVDDMLQFTDTTSNYTFDWDVRVLAEGPHGLSVIAHDSAGRESREDRSVTVALAPPPTPAITSPTGSTLIAVNSVDVIGTGEPGTLVSVLLDGSVVDRVAPNPAGGWSLTVGLQEGQNPIRASASDSVGASPPTPEVLVTVDTGPPDPPPFLNAQELPDGLKRFSWIAPSSPDVASYSLYEATAPFSTTGEATLLQTGIVNVETSATPPSEGTFYYAVTATDQAGNESGLSERVQLDVDLTQPTASLAASPDGLVGPGSVALTLVTSEETNAQPFLSVTPAESTPTPIDLVPTGAPLTWSSTFDVTPDTPSGPVAFSFSARDVALNRGSQITVAPALTVDTEGPRGTLQLTPAQSVLGPGDFTVDLTLDEPAAMTPSLRFSPPAGGPIDIALTGSATTWQGLLTIEASLGDGAAAFELDAEDGFGNVASGPPDGIDVSLDTTAPDAPQNLLAGVRSAGEVELTWAVVIDAATYSVFRVPGGQPFPPVAEPITAGLLSAAYVDLPPADGEWSYAVSATDAPGNESVLSSAADGASDRTPPGDPSGMTLVLEGDAVRADWSPDAGSPGDTFLLYRATAPITSVVGLEPVQTGLLTPTALDAPPSDGNFHYAVVAGDSAGNLSNPATAGPIAFDQGSPRITITGVEDGDILNQIVTIEFSAEDFSLDTLEATLDAVPFASGGTESNEGDHVLVVTATDSSGNSSQQTVGFTLDLTAPEISIEGVADGVAYDVGVTPVVEVSDVRLDTTTITLNGQPFASGTPVTTDDAYTLVVTAEDLAGNSSVESVSFMLDTPPPPVESVSIDLPDGSVPLLSWTPRPEPDVVGYLVERDAISLTPTPQALTTLTDATFDPFGSQVYRVFAVDGAGQIGAPRSVTLSPVSLGLTAQPPVLSRRYLDAIDVEVENRSNETLNGLSLRLVLRNGATEISTTVVDGSQPLPAGETLTLTGVVSCGAGGEATRVLDLELTMSSTPGTSVRVLRSETLAVVEPPAPIQIFNDPLVLGTTGRLKIKLFNHGTANLQALTSQSGGPSPDVEVFLKDGDGNVLASRKLQQTGSGLINTADRSFTNIAGGSSFLTTNLELPIPSTAPETLFAEAVVGRTHSDLLGFTPDVVGPELRATQAVSTGAPAYLADAAPDRTVYDQGEAVLITGRAFDPVSGAAAPDVPVKIGVHTRGFDRFFFADTDSNGDFSLTFQPVSGEAGAYSIWATHPTVIERASQATFDILGLRFEPRAFNLRMSKNSSFPVSLRLRNTGETPLTGFNFEVLTGNGVSTALDTSRLPATLGPGRSASLTLTIIADVAADSANFATLDVTTAENITRSFDVGLDLVQALPVLSASPSFVEVSVPTGSLHTRSVRIRNRGYSPLEGVTLDAPSSSWITLGVLEQLAPIPVGSFADVPVLFAPPDDLTPGIYSDSFVVRSDNHPPFTENLFAIVTSSQTGDAMFEVRNTEDTLIDGASVWIQNLQVPTLTFTQSTDASGLTTFRDLPAGPYQYRAQAPGTQNSVGNFDVEADSTAAISVYNNVVYITVEWSVTPVIIEDRYEFTLTATFETDVPAPVLVTTPASLSISLGPGGTYFGEYTLKNHGLVAADNIEITPRAGGGLVLDTLIDHIDRLGANETITIPFRLDFPAEAEFNGAGGTTPSGPTGQWQPTPLAQSLAAAGIDPRAVAAGTQPFDPCAPRPASVSQVGEYICAAGFLVPVPSFLRITIHVPAGESLADQLGLCDSGCDICDLIKNCGSAFGGPLGSFAGGVCDCISGLASGGLTASTACSCAGAAATAAGIDSSAIDVACNCFGDFNILGCLEQVPGDIGDSAGFISSALGGFGIGAAFGCGREIGQCLCHFLPEACDLSFLFESTPGTGSSNVNLPVLNTGNFGTSYPAILNYLDCDDF
ncbi:MAG: hypothetical protein GY716_08050 [bacterium]|nr:hypothetical protein [bacterium]